MKEFCRYKGGLKMREYAIVFLLAAATSLFIMACDKDSKPANDKFDIFSDVENKNDFDSEDVLDSEQTDETEPEGDVEKEGDIARADPQKTGQEKS